MDGWMQVQLNILEIRYVHDMLEVIVYQCVYEVETVQTGLALILLNL